jgi:prepilin-type N-terminal cleavage/methylation domain-containing protein
MESRRITKLFSGVSSLNGYTLIELLVAISIVVIIAGSLAIYLVTSAGVFSKVQSRKSHAINASLSLKKFNREASLTWGIISSTSKFFQFTTSLDTFLIISYEINADGTLTRKLGSGNKELIARNIDYNSSYINYYDKNGNIGTPIRRIRISLLFISGDDSSRITVDVTHLNYREQ